MNADNTLIHPKITDTLYEVSDIAGRLDRTIAGLSKRDADMQILFSSELTQYSFHLNNVYDALVNCRYTAQGKVKMAKPEGLKNPLIAATLHTTLKRMVKATDDLKAVHRDICYRKKNNAVFTQREIAKFCTTLKRIGEAGEMCRQAIKE